MPPPSSVQRFTGKDSYKFGDLTKAALSRTLRGRSLGGKRASRSEQTAEKRRRRRRSRPHDNPVLSSSSSSSSGEESLEQDASGDGSESGMSSLTEGGSSSTPTYEEAPGPRPRIVIGNVPDILPSLVPAARRLSKKFGPVVRLTLLGRPLYIVSSAAYLGPLLALPDKVLPRQEIATDGIFLADGATWSVARSTLQVCFTDKYMPSFIPTFQDHAEKFLAKLGSLKEGEKFDLYEGSERLMFDVVCEAGFNMESDCFESGRPSDFAVAFETAFAFQKKRAYRLDVLNKIPSSTNRRFKASLNRLNETLDQVIAKSSEAVETNTLDNSSDASGCPVGRDLMSLMLAARHPESGEGLSHENLRHQLITLLVAGHKTASLLLSWSLYEISQHPEVEAEILKEQISIFGADAQTKPDNTAVKKMRYLECVLKETLRLYPPAQSVIRGAAESGDGVVIGDKYLVPPGARVLINVVGVHRDAAYWDNPDSFDPHRFDSANLRKMHPYQFIPFGGGPRMCLGNLFALTEVKIMLSLLIRNFSVRMAEGCPVEIKAGGNPLHPLSGINMTFAPRTDYADLVSGNELSSLLALDDNVPGAERTIASSLAQSVMAPVHAVARTRSSGVGHVDILFGSNQGTCQEFAERLERDAQSIGISATCQSLDDFLPTLLKEASSQERPKPRTLIIVCSSYNGLPTDDAEKFCKWLAEKSAGKSQDVDLSHVEYCVFGCGNIQWAATFQKVPREIDERLAKLGADRLMEMGEGDEDMPSGLEVAISAFSTILWPMLGSEQLPLSVSMALVGVEDGDDDNDDDRHVAKIEAPKRRFVVEMCRPNERRGEDRTPPDLKMFVVSENRELLHVDDERSTRHVELQLPTGVQYETGDHFEVFVRNSDDVIDALALQLGLSADAVFRVKLAEGQSAAALPRFAQDGPCRLRDALAELDILATPSQAVLLQLAYKASKEEEKDALLELAQPYAENLAAYQDYIAAPRRTLGEVLDDHPSVFLTVADLIEVLPPLRPRYYSISSAPGTSAQSLSLTVGVAFDKTSTGRRHNGISSHYIASRQVGEGLAGRIRSSHFRLPSNSNPLIMCCNGTGLAPFRAFLQDLQHRATRPSSVLLFFGCRKSSEDYLYSDELASLQKSGVVTVIPAFSRETDEREYVQDAMAKHSQELWGLISKQNASIMLCGNARTMAKGVRDAVEEIIARSGGMQSNAASKYLDRLSEEGRYILDVWG